MRILAADDDALSRELTVELLREWGYEPVVAADGEEAWQIVHQQDPPRLLILDWMMPRVDGVALCRRLRAEPGLEPLYIVLLTARDRTADAVEGLAAGANDYITKGFHAEELRARIAVGRRVLELHAALSESHKLEGALEMAGAVCHELNQPLQGVLGYAELLLGEIAPDHPGHDLAGRISEQAMRLGELIHRMMSITRYRTRDYLGGRSRIIDIERAAPPPGEES